MNAESDGLHTFSLRFLFSNAHWAMLATGLVFSLAEYCILINSCEWLIQGYSRCIIYKTEMSFQSFSKIFFSFLYFIGQLSWWIEILSNKGLKCQFEGIGPELKSILTISVTFNYLTYNIYVYIVCAPFMIRSYLKIWHIFKRSSWNRSNYHFLFRIVFHESDKYS